MAAKQRMRSLDVLRGIVIAAMILVNNPGCWDYIYRPLDHAVWNSVTPTDFIFPFFITIMGMSMVFSLRKFDYRFSWKAVGKVLRRAAVLALIGYVTGWVSRALNRAADGEPVSHVLWNFDTARVFGVMVRLALVYLFAALLVFALHRFRRAIPIFCAVLLTGYAVLLLAGHGFEATSANVVRRVDCAVVPTAHLYQGDFLDPEGILSTLPCIAQCLLGFWIFEQALPGDRIRSLAVPGTLLMAVGWLLSYGIPLNKKVWSPTFVLVTLGACLLCLAVLLFFVDERGRIRGLRLFESLGSNAMLLFIVSTLLGIVLNAVRFHGVSLWSHYYRSFCCRIVPGSPYGASLLGAVLFVLLMMGLSWPLYRRHIYVKV